MLSLHLSVLHPMQLGLVQGLVSVPLLHPRVMTPVSEINLKHQKYETLPQGTALFAIKLYIRVISIRRNKIIAYRPQLPKAIIDKKGPCICFVSIII